MMINIWAVLSATIVAYLAGALWYSPLLFFNRWCQETATSPQAELASPIRVYGLTFLSTLISALIMHWLLGPAPALQSALLLGLVIGGGVVAASLGINYQFSQYSMALWLIDGGFHCLRFILIALVLSYWPV